MFKIPLALMRHPRRILWSKKSEIFLNLSILLGHTRVREGYFGLKNQKYILNVSILLEHICVRERYFGGVGFKMQDFHSEDRIP